ncbi:MAG: AAA family ATPase, partial [Bacteroidota bacterium]
ALDLALSVADEERGTWLGREVRKHGTVVYIDEENSPDTLLARLVQLGYRDGLLAKHLFLYSFAGVRLDDPSWQNELHQLAQNLGPTLFVFDTFIRFFTSIDENDNSAISVAYQDGILPLSRQYGSAVLILDHPKKGSPDVSRGASDKVNAVDRAVAVIGAPGDPVSKYKHVKPPRRGPSPVAFQVRRMEQAVGTPEVELVAEGTLTRNTNGGGRQRNVEDRQKILAALSEHGPMTAAELASVTDIVVDKLRGGKGLLASMIADEELQKDGPKWTSQMF